MQAIRHLGTAFALVAGLGLATTAAAQTVTLKLHTFVPPKSSNWVGQVAPWMDKVEKDSGGRIRFERYPSMQLGGSPPQLVDQVKDNVVDIIWTLPGYTSGRFPRVEAFELPFMLQGGAENTSKALWEYVQTLGRDDFRDYHVISANVHGAGFFHSREKDIRTLADLKGMKVRGPTRQTTRLLAALGATPVGMPVTQIPDAISKGVVDAVVVPWEIVPAIKLNELARSHSEFDPKLGSLYTAVFVMLMNKQKYEGLPADVKRFIDMNSGLEESARMGRVMHEADAPGKKSAVDRNNRLFVFDAAQTEAFRKASDAVDDEWVREVTAKGLNGRQLLDGARALIGKHAK